MINVDTPIEVKNVGSLLDSLNEKQEETSHNSFLDIDEPAVLDEFIHEQLHFNEYGHLIKQKNGSL